LLDPLDHLPRVVDRSHESAIHVAVVLFAVGETFDTKFDDADFAAEEIGMAGDGRIARRTPPIERPAVCEPPPDQIVVAVLTCRSIVFAEIKVFTTQSDNGVSRGLVKTALRNAFYSHFGGLLSGPNPKPGMIPDLA
jgi:hypothetical protein